MADRSKLLRATLATAVCSLLLVSISYPVNAFDSYSDFLGPYCEISRTGCCLGRQDNCSMPISSIYIFFSDKYIAELIFKCSQPGTLCYCDEMCNRDKDGDCCPDYTSFCLKMPDPITEGCLLNGVRFSKHDAPVKDNCNLWYV